MKNLKKGFTLIELLVVIAIIAMLLSILMPSLAIVKKQAQSVVCKSNLRQLAVAFEAYKTDHNRAMSTGDDSSVMGLYNRPWFLTIAPYMGAADFKDDPSKLLDGMMKVIKCPSAKKLDEIANGWGSNTEAWAYFIPGLEAEGSYGLNTWLAGINFKMQVDSSLGGGWISDNQVKLCSIRKDFARPNSPLIADSSWFEAIPMDASQASSFPSWYAPSMYPDAYPHYRGDDLSTDDRGLTRFCIDRHRMGINIAFFDGHVDKVAIKDLWTLKWNKSFRTTNESFVMTLTSE